MSRMNAFLAQRQRPPGNVKASVDDAVKKITEAEQATGQQRQQSLFASKPQRAQDADEWGAEESDEEIGSSAGMVETRGRVFRGISGSATHLQVITEEETRKTNKSQKKWSSIKNESATVPITEPTVEEEETASQKISPSAEVQDPTDILNHLKKVNLGHRKQVNVTQVNENSFPTLDQIVRKPETLVKSKPKAKTKKSSSSQPCTELESEVSVQPATEIPEVVEPSTESSAEATTESLCDITGLTLERICELLREQIVLDNILYSAKKPSFCEERTLAKYTGRNKQAALAASNQVQ